jgi:hypothetical protein
MVRVDKAPRTYTISTRLPTVEVETLTILADNRKTNFTNSYPIIPADSWSNGYISELYLYCEIDSLVDINIPDYTDEDTRSERIVKTLDMEWKSPRYQVALWTTANPLATANTFQYWNKIGMVSLLQQSGYPYTRYRPLDLLTDNLMRELGENAKVAISIMDVGWFFPNSADVIVVDGSWRQELIIVQPDFVPLVSLGNVQQVTQFTDSLIQLVATASKSVLPTRESRTVASLKNGSPTAVAYYSYNSVCTPTSNDGAIAAGATKPLEPAPKTGVWMCMASGTANCTTLETYTA